MPEAKEPLTDRVDRLQAKFAARELARLTASNIAERRPYSEQELVGGDENDG